MDRTDLENDAKLLDEELQRRIENYYTVCKPGKEESPIQPLTLRRLMPAIIISILLTIYVIIGMVAFPTLYP